MKKQYRGGWDCHDSCYSTTPAQAQFLPTDNMNLRPPPPPPPPPPSPPSPVVSKTTDRNESKESCHTGEKRKLPENEQYRAYYKCPTLPKELTAKFGPLSCDLCNVQVGSPLTAKMHYNGKPHEKKVKAFLAEWSKKTGQSIPPIPKSVQSTNLLEKKYCEICNVAFGSAADAETHFAGRNHMKNVANSASGIPPKKSKVIKEDPTGRFGIGVSFLDGASSVQSNIVAPVTKQDLYCEICNVQATERNQLQEHLSGARHRKALKAQSTSVVPAPVNPSESILASVIRPAEKQKIATDYSMHRTPSGHYYCQPCNMTMNSEEQFSAHVDSRKHKFKVATVKKTLGRDKET